MLLLIAYALTPILSFFGFSSTGVVAGTIAAGVQSVAYGASIKSGSAFAIAQSIAMTTKVSTIAVAGVIGVDAAAAAIPVVYMLKELLQIHFYSYN